MQLKYIVALMILLMYKKYYAIWSNSRLKICSSNVSSCWYVDNSTCLYIISILQLIFCSRLNECFLQPDQQDTNPMMILNNLEDVPQTVYRESRNRSMGVGPMRTRPIDRRIDTSPYSGPYLSPPPDTSWRRTNSDSALHHSAMQGLSDNRSESSGSRWNLNNTDHQHDGRPRSSCDVPRVPGIQ